MNNTTDIDGLACIPEQYKPIMIGLAKVFGIFTIIWFGQNDPVVLIILLYFIKKTLLYHLNYFLFNFLALLPSNGDEHLPGDDSDLCRHSPCR